MTPISHTDTTLTLVLGLTIFALLCLTGYLYYVLATKDEVIQQIQAAYNKMMRSFNDLDEQAKLIVRTDLELNKAQAELDKRLNGLNALQRTSRHISQALNEDEIFSKLSPMMIEELGFARALILTVDENSQLKLRMNVNFNDERIKLILTEVNRDETLKTILKDTHTISSSNSPRKVKEKIGQSFESEHFVLAPIITQTGFVGFVFMGNRYNAPAVTQGDEELIGIFAGQIGQSLENTQLFDKVFRSSQELEIKVKDRTKQLAFALAKVEEINKKKSEFISAVSHELRTPLTSIKGYASILIAGKIGEVPTAVKERLIKINTHSDNLVSLINNLLDIARIESGHQEMKFAPYKVKHVVDNIVDLLGPQIAAKEIELRVQIPADISDIFIDISQAERVFINLLSNAIKFTPKKGLITLGVSPTIDNGYATFSVTDTGIGIPEADLQKLFSEFFRVDNEINQIVKGTGLGLVLAKNIIQAHRGQIWVKSKVAEGTTFFFTLPVTAEAFEHNKITAV